MPLYARTLLKSLFGARTIPDFLRLWSEGVKTCQKVRRVAFGVEDDVLCEACQSENAIDCKTLACGDVMAALDTEISTV